MTLPRFDLFITQAGSHMRKRSDGDWVEFKEVESLVEKLNDEIARLRVQVEHYQRDSEPL
jgi:hypothetical protein